MMGTVRSSTSAMLPVMKTLSWALSLYVMINLLCTDLGPGTQRESKGGFSKKRQAGVLDAAASVLAEEGQHNNTNTHLCVLCWLQPWPSNL